MSSLGTEVLQQSIEVINKLWHDGPNVSQLVQERLEWLNGRTLSTFGYLTCSCLLLPSNLFESEPTVREVEVPAKNLQQTCQKQILSLQDRNSRAETFKLQIDSLNHNCVMALFFSNIVYCCKWFPEVQVCSGCFTPYLRAFLSLSDHQQPFPSLISTKLAYKASEFAQPVTIFVPQSTVLSSAIFSLMCVFKDFFYIVLMLERYQKKITFQLGEGETENKRT